jgi:lysophospholipase L1-like esterase
MFARMEHTQASGRTSARVARSHRGFLATLGKTLFGLAVFSATVGGWAAMQHRAAMHTPLPGAGGREGACVVWFVGSSSFYRWTTLSADMAPWIVRNRGVGGAFLPELRQRFANEGPVTAPQAIVFYAGENDIAKGATAAAAQDEFRRFVAAKMAKMPRVPMLALSVKPTPHRWAQRPVQRAYDAGTARIAAGTPALRFVDASAGLLVDGRPGAFFIADGVHMNPAGYRVWARTVRRALADILPRNVVARCGGRSGEGSGA